MMTARHRLPERGSGLALIVAAFVGACGVQPHPTVETPPPSTPGTAGTTGSAGVTGTGGDAGTSGQAGTSGEAGSIGPAGNSGSSGSSGASGAGTGGQSTGGSSAGGGRGGTVGTGGAAGSTTGTGGSGGSTTGKGGTTGTGGSATSGAGVTINGKFVPKEKAVVIIHIGHSNMRGQATKPTSLMSYFYNTQDGLWSYKGTFTLAKEPTAPEGTMTFAGPGMAMLHSAKTALQSGSDVQLISVGYGKGSVTTVDYQKSTNTYYPIFMNWAQQLKGNVTFGAIVIMLGITDGEHLPTAQVPAFPSRVAQLVSDMRADLGEPNLPVLFCDYEQNASGTLAPTGSVGVVMQPLVRMLPGMVSKLVLVPTDGIEMQDDHHFDMQGHKDWSDRVIMLMKSNGWWHW
jgi:hypothetical protein